MTGSSHRQWILAMLFAGVLYLVAGLALAALAKSAATSDARVGWRLTAWIISAVVFAAHIAYDQLRLHSSSTRTALHASLAVAIGAFGLAMAASLHGRAVHQPFPPFALAVWPVMTAVPAFLVALVAAAVLTRMRQRT